MIRAAIQSTDDTSVQQPGDEPGELAEDEENADTGTASPFLRQTQHTHIYIYIYIHVFWYIYIYIYVVIATISLVSCTFYCLLLIKRF